MDRRTLRRKIIQEAIEHDESLVHGLREVISELLAERTHLLESLKNIKRYQVEAVETWMSHICPAFKPRTHGKYVMYKDIQSILEECDERLQNT